MDIYDAILETFSPNPCRPQPRTFEQILALMPSTFSATEIEAALARLEACGSVYRQDGKYREAGMSRDAVVNERAGYGGIDENTLNQHEPYKPLTSYDPRYTIHGVSSDAWRFK